MVSPPFHPSSVLNEEIIDPQHENANQDGSDKAGVDQDMEQRILVDSEKLIDPGFHDGLLGLQKPAAHRRGGFGLDRGIPVSPSLGRVVRPAPA